MKKLINILSLGILLANTLIPTLTLADEITLESSCLDIYHFEVPGYSSEILQGYSCEDGGNVIIPEGIDSIDGSAFKGIEIKTLQIPENTIIQNEAFSGAIIVGNINFNEINNSIANYAFDGLIVGNGGNVTINSSYRTNHITVNEGGTINIVQDTEYGHGMLNYSTINGTVNINGDSNSYTNSFNYSIINNNSNIKINGIEQIDNSFNNTTINTGIDFSGLSILSDSFKYSYINKNINFDNANGINIKNNSFYNSNIISDININGSETNIINSFNNTTMSGNISIDDDNLVLNNTFEDSTIISGNVIIQNTSSIKLVSIEINSIQGDLKLISNGNFIIEQGNFNIKNLGGNLELSGTEIPLLSAIRPFSGPVNIGKDLIIRGNKIIVQYGTLDGTIIEGNLIIEGELVDLNTDVINNTTIGGNIEIKAGQFKAQNNVLNSLKLGGELKLPENTSFGNNVLGGVITKGSAAMGYSTKVSIGNELNQSIIDDILIVVNEISNEDISKSDNTTIVQNSEIQVTSGKVAEYKGGLSILFQNSNNEGIEGTAIFSSPIAIKVPVTDMNNEYVKIKVKHSNDEEFGYTGLTLNPENNCNDGIAVHDQYSGEDVKIEDSNGEKFATIYTCSASTFVAYSENDPVIEEQQTISNQEETKETITIQPSAGGGRTITAIKQETKTVEQEHNSADTVESEITTQTSEQSTNTVIVKEQVKKIEGRALTRGEVAIMTNILLEVYPQLVEGKQELDDVTNACSNYADEQNFTKDEKKAITRLCKLSIMGIHNDTNKPLEEFLVNNKTTNDEFSKVIDRSVSTYNEKDLSTIKDALKKLEGDEENVVFGTVYDMFMSIKNIFN